MFTVLLAVPGLPGCEPPIDHTGETIELALDHGATASGILISGQGLRATVTVEAEHNYEVRAGLTEAIPTAAGTTATEGAASGAPLAQPVAFSIAAAPVGGVQGLEGTIFAPDSNGDVTLEMTYQAADEPEPLADILEALRDLIRGEFRANYELLVIDLGLDDNGISPEGAVALEIGAAGEQTGTITPGDEGDYFVLRAQGGADYRLELEATAAVTATSGTRDRFGQINFGIASPGGLIVNTTASAGTPSVVEFTTPRTEELFFHLTPGEMVTSSAPSIDYAIKVVEVAGNGG